MEFIFVNDCTPDNSMILLESVLTDYPQRRPMVKIVNHSQNYGLHMARRTGVSLASGKYIIICDSDDWCELNMMEVMYNKAIECNADIVVNNSYIEYPDHQEKTFIVCSETPQECIRNLYKKERFAIATWRNMVKKDIYSLSFFDNIIPSHHGEDLFLTLQIYYYSKRIAFVNNCLYHYNRTMMFSMSRGYKRTKSALHAQLTNIQMVCTMLNYKETPLYRKACHCIMFAYKMGYKSAFDSERSWFYCHKECHKDIIYFESSALIARLKMWMIYNCYFLYKVYTKLTKV